MDVDHFGDDSRFSGDSHSGDDSQLSGGSRFSGGGDDTISMGASIPPPPGGGRRWTSRTVVFASVAGIALAGGAGIGYAATSSSSGSAANTTAAAASPSPSAAPATPVPARPGYGRGWRGRAGFGGPLGFGLGRAGLGGVGRGGVLHGQFTVRKPGGGYETLDIQSGTASSVSGTSLTVKSADGYTATYSVTGSTLVDAKANGIGSVNKGDTVVVTATAGSTPKAASVMDVTAIRAGRASLGFPGRMRVPKFTAPPAPPVPSASPAPPAPPASPVPSASPTAGSTS